MNDELSALVGRFLMMLKQAGCRGTPPRHPNPSKGLARRDLVEIAAAADALPGDWNVETPDSDAETIGRTVLRPSTETKLPTFAFARSDGFITVRMTRPGQGVPTGSVVFGVFTSIVAAFDAIHNDVVARDARIGRMVVGVT